MRKSLREHDVCHQQTRRAQETLPPARMIYRSIIRHVLTFAAPLAPASMIITTSCDLNCSARCESEIKGPPCYREPASTCLDGGTEYSCAVRTGCHCAGMSSSNPEPAGCNTAACDYIKDQASCSAKASCEWGDACQDLIDCHIFDQDQNGCNAHERQCSWHRDCG
jgi:hypothetical protein